jgi:hypothetical protein
LGYLPSNTGRVILHDAFRSKWWPLPTALLSGARHGNQRRSANQDRDERSRPKDWGIGLGDQQCGLTHRRLAGCRGFGTLLTGVFQGALNRRLKSLDHAPAVRAEIESKRCKLAAAESVDPRGRRAINEAFVAGCRRVVWLSMGLALVSSPAVLISTEIRVEHQMDAG